MAGEAVRVGLIGAGRNTRERHIPGFQKVEGVELAAVANRSRQSGQAVADETAAYIEYPRNTAVKVAAE